MDGLSTLKHYFDIISCSSFNESAGSSFSEIYQNQSAPATVFSHNILSVLYAMSDIAKSEHLQSTAVVVDGDAGSGSKHT